MRIALSFLFFCILFSSASNSYSQEFTLKSRTASIKEVCREIEKGSDYVFIFSDNSEKLVDKKVNVEAHSKNVAEILDIILSDTGLTYRILDKQIVVYKSEEAASSITVEQPDINITQQPTKKQITGRIVDINGEAVIGANIIEAGTINGTVTDVDGHFTLNVENNANINISYIGYQTQEISTVGKTSFDIELVEDSKILDEVVAIGYGTIRKSDLTGSVAQINTENFKMQPINQFTEILSGTVAGFYSKQGYRASGGGSMEIRGPNSLTASTSPLIVIDGVIYNGSISDINPNDIKTIDVLKDASSAAIYGAKAASGVILITTTKGTVGKPRFDFSVKIGYSEALNKDFISKTPEEYLEYKKDFFRTLGNKNIPDYYWFSPENLPEGITLEQWRNASNNPNPDNTKEWLSRLNLNLTESGNYLANRTVDWRKEVLPGGPRQEYDISISGGSENITYYWSGGYLNNKGIIRGDNFSIIRTRLNNEFKVTDWLKTGINMQYAYRDESPVIANLGTVVHDSPFSTMYNEDGSINWYPYGYPRANPLLDYYGQDKYRKIQSLFGSLYSEISLPFGFSYRLAFQPRFENIKDYNNWSPNTYRGSVTYPNGYATRNDFSNYEWIFDNLLKWNKVINTHSFDFTFLYSLEKDQSWDSFSSNYNFQPVSTLGYHGLQYGINPLVNSNDVRVTGDALMARLNYILNDKYLFTGTIRRDGYSAFGLNYPRAIFPSVSFAWHISNENFYNSDWFVNRAKMRISWGKNGNRDIGVYSALSVLNIERYYDGSMTQIGLNAIRLSNKELRWEETESVNIGFDLGFINNQLDMNVDIYHMNTFNLLVNRTLPKITGFESIISNLGQLYNQGIELTLVSRNINLPKFNWKTTFTYSANRNKIMKLFGDRGQYVLESNTLEGELPDYTNKWFPNHAIDAIWDYDILGIWQVEEEAEAAKYGLSPGDFKANDLDNDGNYEAIQDKTFIGYMDPRHRFGLINEFSFLKNIHLFVFLRADLGHKNSFPYSTEGWSVYDRQSAANYPYWTPENRSNQYPRLSKNITPFGGEIMLYKPASFLRLQDISIQYDFPTNKFASSIQKLSLFVSARNLLTLSKWPGFDPESGHSPMPKTFTFGINISL